MPKGLLGALQDPEFYQGLLDNTRQLGGGLLSGTLGAPVDIMTMLMRPAGYRTPDKRVVGSSEHIGGLLGLNTESTPFKVGSLIPNDPSDLAKLGLLGMAKAQAPKGGAIADANGYFYRGGQFLPSTTAEPGTWKVAGRTIKTGKAQVGPREYEVQPSPLSRSIYELVGAYAKRNPDGSLAPLEGIRDATGMLVTRESRVRPGVKGFVGKTDYSVGELIEQYNNGAKWVDVDVDLPPELIKPPRK